MLKKSVLSQPWSPAVEGNAVVASHGDENLDVADRGMIGTIDGSQRGDIKRANWAVTGIQFGFTSP